MNAQQLKNSILQMAVSGKLVPQDPNDEPASVLLDRIRKEKEKLIKEGMVKKEKNPSYIFRGADNTPYEKVGKNEPVSIADDVPFEIPDSWEWIRLGTVCEVARGGSPRPIKDYLTDSDDGINWIKIGDSDKGGKYINSTKEKIIPEGMKKSRFVHAGDFLLTNSMSFGRPYILNVDGCIHDGWLVLSDYEIVYDRDFLYYMLSSAFAYSQFCDVVSGAVVKNLNSDKVAASLFPVPPLAEQKRIVTAIETIEPYIIEYNKAESQLSALQTEFPERLKKSVLQIAIQGKLVPQDPNDEPASALLKRIREEKERLIKAGKIKREKNESVIYRRDNSHYEKFGTKEYCIDDEIPFEIPDSWEWCRMSAIFSINPRNQLSDDTVVGFMPMPLLEEGFNNHHTFEERIWKDVKSGFTHFKDNDVVVAKITPCFQNRKSAVISGLPNGYGAGTTELHVLRDETNNIYMPYILLVCKTHAFITCGVAAFTGTAGQQRVGKDYIANYLLPLPPLHEQIRITNAVQTILSTLSELL